MEVGIILMSAVIICLISIITKCQVLLKRQKIELQEKDVLLSRLDRMTDDLIQQVKKRDKFIDALNLNLKFKKNGMD